MQVVSYNLLSESLCDAEDWCKKDRKKDLLCTLPRMAHAGCFGRDRGERRAGERASERGAC